MDFKEICMFFFYLEGNIQHNYNTTTQMATTNIAFFHPDYVPSSQI